jgi:hypothetical protein
MSPPVKKNEADYPSAFGSVRTTGHLVLQAARFVCKLIKGWQSLRQKTIPQRDVQQAFSIPKLGFLQPSEQHTAP